MKKFRVTEKHGFLKLGFVKFMTNGNIYYTEHNADITCITYILDFKSSNHTVKWLESG